MFDQAHFIDGAIAFLLAFGLACLFLIVFKYLYQAVTPYNERTLIREGNTAAAVTLGGAIIGFALPVASALGQTASLAEFAAWALLAGVIQVLAFVIVSKIVVKDLHDRIGRGEVSTAIYLAATSIAIGLINAASMTY